MCDNSVTAKKKYIRWCFVPLCKNTEIKTPEKVFVSVPRSEKLRKKWFLAANRIITASKSCFYCCEDHFDLRNDMENYLRWTIMKGPIKLKEGVIPHIFDCQPDRSTSQSSKPRPLVEKLQRKRLIEEILEEKVDKCDNTTKIKKMAQNEVESLDLNSMNLEETTTEAFEIKHLTKGTNTIRCSYKSREVLVKPSVCDFGCSVTASTSDFGCWVKPYMVDSTISSVKSPMKPPNTFSATPVLQDDDCSTTSSEYQPSSVDFESEEDEQMIEMAKTALSTTIQFISRDPKNYIGVPEKWYWMIEELSTACKISLVHIKLVLMKIKTNDTFLRLADQFGLSRSGASRIFTRHVSNIAHMLQPFILFPEKKSIKKLLPIPFRLNFSNVVAIIDCFEIQIEKPSNSLHQALTWSEYKKCNTLKYLICISPDGLITFISEGFGGRVSDAELFSNSKIMEVLPSDSELMVDRGFKQIQTILHTKNIKLVRPPSVSSGEKMSKEEVILTKRVASLRIHVERVIRRLREFSMLEPHATVDHNLLPYINSVVKIASALVNLQDPIIKT